jgi:2-haloacid dehalogenase
MMEAVSNTVRALVFDVWGTVVDWHSSVLEELRAFGTQRGLGIDWEFFLTEWQSAYNPGKNKVNNGELPWTTVDALYRQALERLLVQHKITGVTDSEIEHLNRAWTRMRPWPDSVAGFMLLKRRYVLSTLSNGSFSWLVDIARFAGLPFDCIISAENARCYKPRPEVYLTAMALLGRKPEEVMLVAAHNYDLRAARALGMRTAFIPRPAEFGPRPTKDSGPEQDWDVVADNLIDLARKMGAQ